uniref:Uncharacterized protein n=1 Tax=Panagrolaimus superbus TaxID=310955 RepID=A0A914XZY0_9BILA
MEVDLENMTPAQEIVDQSTIVFKLASDENKNVVTYKEFCDSLLEDRGVDVTAVAKEAGFENPYDFLKSLDLNVNDNGDLIVKVDAEDESTVTKFIEGSRREEQQRLETQERRRQPYPRYQNYVSQARREVENVVAPVQANVIINEAPQNLSPPVVRQLYEIHIFDGDEEKLMPGMRVKISTGAIFTLDSIPFPGSTEPQCKKLNLKAGQKFPQKSSSTC